MAFLSVVFLYVAISVLCVLGGYAAGSVFDMMMGSNITPVTTFGMLFIGYENPHATGKGISWNIKEIIGDSIALILITLATAFVVQLLLPQMVNTFMEQVAFEGSIYTLAFWASLLMLGAKRIVNYLVYNFSLQLERYTL